MVIGNGRVKRILNGMKNHDTKQCSVESYFGIVQLLEHPGEHQQKTGGVRNSTNKVVEGHLTPSHGHVNCLRHYRRLSNSRLAEQ